MAPTFLPPASAKEEEEMVEGYHIYTVIYFLLSAWSWTYS